MKLKTRFVCQECGFAAAKWIGKCPDCNAWNSFAEESFSKASDERSKETYITLSTEKPVPLSEVSLLELPRTQTKISELDRVLGGGIVPGSLILLGGDPGIGKSTLVLEMLDQIKSQNQEILYVTGEESREQVKLRAERLGIGSDLLVVSENSLDKILKHAESIKPKVMVTDSIQTIYLPHLESAPGSVSQVRECTGKLMYFSKTTGITTLLVGHVTKEGALAGPRILEHMVDTVLYFEGDPSGEYRILRTIKNRFGSTNEIGVFEMTSQGLKEVTNPSKRFLSGRSDKTIGSCIACTLEGTRPILVEMQALVSDSMLNNPRRTALGVDSQRVSLLVAVLEKTAGMNLYQQDIYANVAGGLKIQEPSTDAALVLAMISSFRNRPIPPDLVAMGEIGLGGELRPLGLIDVRISEAQKLGYRKIIIPKHSQTSEKYNQIELLRASSLEEMLNFLF